MLRRVCRVCGSGMTPCHGPGEAGYRCEHCNDVTPYDEREMDAHCPDCGGALTVCTSCGSQGFFCNTCGSIKSGRRVVWK